MIRISKVAAFCLVCGIVVHLVQAQRPGRGGGDASLANDPFVGVTTNGTVEKGLFKIESTGVSTEPVRKAAIAFLDGLTDEQALRTMFHVDHQEWRQWDNRHFYQRQGVGFDEMNGTQRELAFGLMKASLSAKGLKLSKDILVWPLRFTLVSQAKKRHEQRVLEGQSSLRCSLGVNSYSGATDSRPKRMTVRLTLMSSELSQTQSHSPGLSSMSVG